MGTEYEQAYCKDCKKRVRAERPGTNVTAHVILSIVTLGLWLFIWGFAVTLAVLKGFHCPNCGGSNLKRKFMGVIGSFPENEENTQKKVVG